MRLEPQEIPAVRLLQQFPVAMTNLGSRTQALTTAWDFSRSTIPPVTTSGDKHEEDIGERCFQDRGMRVLEMICRNSRVRPRRHAEGPADPLGDAGST